MVQVMIQKEKISERKFRNTFPLYRKSAFQSIIDYCARGSFDVPFSTCIKISLVVKYKYVNN